jgi:hypothetical protein
MSEDLAFAPYMQSSIGAAVVRTTPDGPADVAPALTLARPGQRPVPMPPPAGLRMLGPEGVLGISARSVLRVDPAPGSSDNEPNYLPCIEFDDPGLPWLFTPARADNGRLRPWLVLVVLEKDSHPVNPGRPLPFVEVGSARLPDLANSWAWAHIQRPADAPGPLVSRLLCPRRLQADTEYAACVVPAFKGGVAAGLGGTGSAVDVHGDAWGPGQDAVLPVYHHWVFRTGLEGDFEQLARAVVPLNEAEAGALGGRTVDITRPWRHGEPLASGRPAGTPQTITVQGALSLFGAPEGTATPAALTDFGTRIAAHISQGTADDVAPPLYGGRPIVRTRIDPSETGWPATLNLDPRHRTTASLGADWVRTNQEFLMAKAWEQAAGLREINRLRRQTAFCGEVAASLHRRGVRTLSPDELLRLAGPVRDRIRTGSGLPLRTEVAVSPGPDELVAPALHRLMRPRGPLARRAHFDGRAYVSRTLTGQLVAPLPVPMATKPVASQPVTGEGTSELSAGIGAALRAVDTGQATHLLKLLPALALSAETNGFPGEARALTDMVSAPVMGILGEPADGMSPMTLLSAEQSLTPDAVAPRVGELVGRFAALPADFAMNVPESGVAMILQTAGDEPGRHLLESGVPIDADSVTQRLAEALDPVPMLTARMESLVPGFFAESSSPTDPVMMCPDFSAPMALALRESEPDWFLPGSASIPDNRAVLLKANGEFIASFMAGANDEMNRELRWREYPTDLRGSPFTHFWPRADGMPDVPPVHTWAPEADLGAPIALGAGGLEVLLIRGPIVRRYPQMVVAAVPAAAVREEDLAEHTWITPSIVLTMDERTSAYAFELPEGDIRDWWFVLAENGYRMRFGFDTEPADPAGRAAPLKTWNDLRWDHVADGRGFAVIGDLTPPADEPDGRPWNAGEVARMALQRPFRVLRSARSLIGD